MSPERATLSGWDCLERLGSSPEPWPAVGLSESLQQVKHDEIHLRPVGNSIPFHQRELGLGLFD